MENGRLTVEQTQHSSHHLILTCNHHPSLRSTLLRIDTPLLGIVLHRHPRRFNFSTPS